MVSRLGTYVLTDNPAHRAACAVVTLSINSKLRQESTDGGKESTFPKYLSLKNPRHTKCSYQSLKITFPEFQGHSQSTVVTVRCQTSKIWRWSLNVAWWTALFIPEVRIFGQCAQWMSEHSRQRWRRSTLPFIHNLKNLWGCVITGSFCAFLGSLFLIAHTCRPFLNQSPYSY